MGLEEVLIEALFAERGGGGLVEGIEVVGQEVGQIMVFRLIPAVFLGVEFR